MLAFDFDGPGEAFHGNADEAWNWSGDPLGTVEWRELARHALAAGLMANLAGEFEFLFTESFGFGGRVFGLEAIDLGVGIVGAVNHVVEAAGVFVEVKES